MNRPPKLSAPHRADNAPAPRHVARKRFGQHFLADDTVVAAILAAINPQPGEALVEIGPGLGALTRPLVARSGRVTVIEIDRGLAARLRDRPELDVIEADVLQVDFAALAAEQGRKLRVVGNLPYNISTPILFHLLTYIEEVQDQHVMLQKEVVARMVARPGNKEYGRLSVMLQWRYRTEAVLDVPPLAFDPPPRVTSTLVRMVPLAPGPGVDVVLLGALVSEAFSQRRKLLRNTLGRWLAARGFSGEFDLQRRAEEVPVDEYLTLARSLGALRST